MEKIFDEVFLHEKGQGVIEYALVLAFIAVFAVVVTSNGTVIGEKVSMIFESIAGMFS